VEAAIKCSPQSADDPSMGSAFTIVISLVVAVPLLVMALLVEKLAQRS
jgi:ABC-type spermidine/putrescine transport system permease subunit I